MKEETFSDLWPVILIAAILSIVLGYVVLRWIFSVNKQLRNQEHQIALLKLIALKLGVAESELPVEEKR